MSSNKIRAHIVLDKSGSMAPDWPNTLVAVNSYVKELAVDATLDAKVSLTAFCSQSTELLRDDIKASDFKPLTVDEVRCGAMTPLRDAVGGVIGQLRQKGNKRRKALVVMTDGFENASQEVSADALKKLIGQCQEDGWLMLYLGADHDAWNQARAMGYSQQHVGQFDKAKVGETMTVASTHTRAYAAGASAATMEFSEEDRAKMKGEPEASPPAADKSPPTE